MLNRCGSLRLELMDLAGVYKQQFGWRDWPTIFDALPTPKGQLVLDLGCGLGDLTAELVARGARVIGIDASEELLSAARSRQLANAEFRSGDVRALRNVPERACVPASLQTEIESEYRMNGPPCLRVGTNPPRRKARDVRGLSGMSPSPRKTSRAARTFELLLGLDAC